MEILQHITFSLILLLQSFYVAIISRLQTSRRLYSSWACKGFHVDVTARCAIARPETVEGVVAEFLRCKITRCKIPALQNYAVAKFPKRMYTKHTSPHPSHTRNQPFNKVASDICGLAGFSPLGMEDILKEVKASLTT